MDLRRVGHAAYSQAIAVYFSPHGGCTEAVVRELGRATNDVEVQAYSFTSKPIAEALVDAARRGVRVRVILDRSESAALARGAATAGVPTWIDAKHAIAHNKVMVIDGQTVLTGSFNFTKQAEDSNAENLLVLHDADLARQYLTNWTNHLEHSERYAGKK